MLIRVDNLDALEAVKKMILLKKNPNRKPFPKTHIHSGNCGHRCDLCVHFKGQATFIAEEMDYARECCSAVYGIGSWEQSCDGCHFPDCTSPLFHRTIESATCRKSKELEKCLVCGNYTTCTKTAGWPPKIHTRTITADQVTYAILPYVKGQYGN